MSDFAIGDISGYKREFDLLTATPSISRIIAMGDIIDRGPESRQMIEFFLRNPKHICLMGNHEHMFIKVYEEIMEQKKSPYFSLIWIFVNGGKETLESYGIDFSNLSFSRSEILNMRPQERAAVLNQDAVKEMFHQFRKIPKEHIEFLASLPLKFETDTAFYSHAPINNWKNPYLFDYKVFDKNDMALDLGALWNRTDPKRPRDDEKFVVYGHQNKKSVLAHTEKHPIGEYVDVLAYGLPEKTWGACIDTVKAGYLTGLKMDDKTLHYQVLIESKNK